MPAAALDAHEVRVQQLGEVAARGRRRDSRLKSKLLGGERATVGQRIEDVGAGGIAEQRAEHREGRCGLHRPIMADRPGPGNRRRFERDRSEQA